MWLLLFLASAPVFDVQEFRSSAIDSLIEALTLADGRTDEVWLRIDTSGGSIQGGLRLMRRLETMRSRVVCVVDAKGYSMGAYLLESPGCDLRLMTARATLMFHRPVAMGVDGNADELRQEAFVLDALGSSLIEATAGRLHMSPAKLARLMQSDFWLSSSAALTLGAVDAIIDPSEIPASVVLP